MSSKVSINPVAAKAIQELVANGLLEAHEEQFREFNQFRNQIGTIRDRLNAKSLKKTLTELSDQEKQDLKVFLEKGFSYTTYGDMTVQENSDEIYRLLYTDFDSLPTDLLPFLQKLLKLEMKGASVQNLIQTFISYELPKGINHKFLFDLVVVFSDFRLSNLDKEDAESLCTYLGIKDSLFPTSLATVQTALLDFLPKFYYENPAARFFFPNIIYDRLVAPQRVEKTIQEEESTIQAKATPEVAKAVKEVNQSEVEVEQVTNYWWLNLNGSEGDFPNYEPGETFQYAPEDAKGGLSPLPVNFKSLSYGDQVIGFERSPIDKVIGLFEVSSNRPNAKAEKWKADFSIVEWFPEKVPLTKLQADPALLKTKALKTQRRALYQLTEAEFETILQLARVPIQEKEATHPPLPLRHLQTRLVSDRYAQEDELQLKPFADAIVQIIRRKESPPPLNLAIIAPWGHGKTTLMRFIEEQFALPVDDSSFGFQAKLRDLRNWLQEPTLQFKKLKNPTVWFNPWRYQSSHQVWAGMGHAIITQLVEKLDPVEREKFWLALQWERIDRHAVRKDIFNRVGEKLLPAIGVSVLALVAGLWTWASAEALLDPTAIGTSISGLGAAIYTWYKNLGSQKETLNNSLDGKFGTWIQQPDYQGEMGLYHHIHEDLKKVFRLLVHNGEQTEPAIIFIDDLDRCSPTVVAEVVEAINLVMNDNDLSQYCYFVLGMDAEMVAASLDVAYKDMAGKFAERERRFGSVGWFFLDKFVQLPFFVPVMKNHTKQEFLARLFGHNNLEAPLESEVEIEVPPTPELNTPEAKQVLQKKVVTALRSRKEEDLEDLRTSYGSRNKELATAFVTQGLEVITNDDPEIWQEVKHFSTYLSASPRSLKRFANLLRFYHIQQRLRELQLGREANFKSASTGALALWLLIALRWPQLVRWVQWEYERKLIVSRNCEEKARYLDEAMDRVEHQDPKDENAAYQYWLSELLSPATGTQFEEEPDVESEAALYPWMRDKELFQTLYKNRSKGNRLQEALVCGVW